MKTQKLVLIFFAIILAFSCSKNDDYKTDIILDVKSNSSSQENVIADRMSCLQSVDCYSSYVFRTDNPFQNPIYDSIIVNFVTATSQEEVNCIRQEYFTCFSNLKMSVLQPSAYNKDVWLLPKQEDPIYTGGVISGTMEEDPRVCPREPCD